MSFVLILSILVIFFLIELLYFRIADQYNIIDKPNYRSSHKAITIRGGGVIFCLSVLLFFVLSGFQYPYFTIGLLFISIISFLDDILTLNSRVRLIIHLIAVFLLLHQWDLFNMPWFWLVIASVFVIGIINAYNFMDGINGITGSYSLLAVGTLYYINQNVVPFISSDFLIIIGLSLLVFNFFNFRTKAKCFAGDVGSISMAFIIVFCIGQLIIKTNNFSYILLLLVYGLDTVLTIFFRIMRRENILEAHRSHFYQYLANEKRYPHLLVSGIYMLIQLAVNCLLLFYVNSSYLFALSLFAIMLISFIGTRFLMEGKKLLLLTKEDK